MTEDYLGVEHMRELFKKANTMSDRSYEVYQGIFGFSDSELKNKVVVDLGSGVTQKFARDALRKGIKIISINPELTKHDLREAGKNSTFENIASKIYRKKRESLAADSYNLPLADESVDVLFSVMAVPHYLPEEETSIQQSFDEMIRVLKGNGKMYLLYHPKEGDTLVRTNLDRLRTENMDVGTVTTPEGYEIVTIEKRGLESQQT